MEEETDRQSQREIQSKRGRVRERNLKTEIACVAFGDSVFEETVMVINCSLSMCQCHIV